RARAPREPARAPADPAERGPEDRRRSEPGDHAGLGAERAEERARDPRAREHGEDPGAHQCAEGDRERDVPRAAGEKPRRRLALEAPRGEPVHDREQRRNDEVKPHGHLEVEQPAGEPPLGERATEGEPVEEVTEEESLGHQGTHQRLPSQVWMKSMKTPGYSGAMRVASSSRVMISGDTCTTAAPRLSSSCARFRAPMITDVISGFSSCQASASCAGVQPASRAAATSTSTMPKA